LDEKHNAYTHLEVLNRRSKIVANESLRRANIHLFIGILIGALGVVFFISFSSKAELSEINWNSLIFYLISILPRIAILIFIEITAGFFLKQYRTAMEEYRYFEEIQRQREYALTAYVLRRDHPKNDLLVDLSKSLMEAKPVGVLDKDETTAILETQKHSKNEYENLMLQFGNILKQASDLSKKINALKK